MSLYTLSPDGTYNVLVRNGGIVSAFGLDLGMCSTAHACAGRSAPLSVGTTGSGSGIAHHTFCHRASAKGTAACRTFPHNPQHTHTQVVRRTDPLAAASGNVRGYVPLWGVGGMGMPTARQHRHRY